MMDQRLQRLRQAYLLMAKQAHYRPQALGDGLDGTTLSDPERLEHEADAYAANFRREEDEDTFWIGCNDFRTNPTFIWVVEAALLLAGGNDNTALALLEMAAREIRREGRMA